MKFKSIICPFADFFFPNVCMSCGQIVENGETLCDNCRENLDFIGKQNRCKFCGMKKPYCDCRNHIYYFERAVCVFFNSKTAKNIVYRYKLGFKSFYSEKIAEYMVNAFYEEYKDINFDAIVTVPTSFMSSNKRGFDHTYLLAKEISNKTGIPLFKNVLRVRALKPSQHKSDYKHRFSNVKNKYYFKRKIDFENVLLVDDIKTTGATLDACSKQLLLAGARHIFCLTALGGGHSKPTGKADIKKLKKIEKSS